VSTPTPVPTIGRIVHYRLRGDQATVVNDARRHARDKCFLHLHEQHGTQLHTGNEVKAGDVFPMMVIRVWGDTPGCAVNGQVYLDGNDVLWATSVSVGEGPGTFSWPAPAATVAPSPA
jgi:hypothetical protein